MCRSETDADKTLLTMQEWEQMRTMDIQTADKTALADIRDVHIDDGISGRDRLLSYVRQIQNPYCYLDNGMVVKISFAGKCRLEECLSEYIRKSMAG